MVALPLAGAGKVRALAVTSPQRSPVAPDLPTLSESGLPGFEAMSWFGLLAPAGTPPAVLQRLEAETQKALAGPAMKERLASMGVLPGAPTAAAFAQAIQNDIRRWAPRAAAAAAPRP
jgi:tripartite-type tricarboxylate transporter receptor subunit TctC